MSEKLLILLPPSETKTDGGNSLFPSASRWSELDPIREEITRDLVTLSQSNEAAAAKALKISAKLAEIELTRNQQLLDAPPLKAAVERYTGVLYDALDAASLTQVQRQWLEEHVAIHSALYGLVGAGDGIAAYRLSHNSKLAGESLKARWRDAISDALAEHPGPILDLRSKGYVDLGPLPESVRGAWGNVAERQPDGSLRSLNHFNKQAKGQFVRLLAQRLAGTANEPLTLEALSAVVAPEFEVYRDQEATVNIVRHHPQA
ncbi:YaaA family protein [Gulosibacter chungangensis]|uniref:Peroxide stress protein YaaA n=1 Tax=Gulosibacter chungangensis TaxID=979746 RepID=A0A7J5BBU3_9MICO|nr:peroxide stress protein YaaA [Gulosibacter chungangensis]KAB1643586.1 peroxide stress protein YaaA [Gulosibacter chungangensis]